MHLQTTAVTFILGLLVGGFVVGAIASSGMREKPLATPPTPPCYDSLQVVLQGFSEAKCPEGAEIELLGDNDDNSKYVVCRCRAPAKEAPQTDERHEPEFIEL